MSNDLLENLEGVFNFSVNESEGNRKKKLAGKKQMLLSLKKMGRRPLWRRQLASARGQQNRKQGLANG